MNVPPTRRTLGRYEVLRELGRGSLGVVYLARQPDLDRLVALKEITSVDLAGSDQAQTLLNELRLAGGLNHPNIVYVYEHFEEGGRPCLVMQYLERGSLRRFMGPLRLAQAGGVLEGMLAALAHADAQGVVHGDVKPENVLVADEGTVKIADFGMARVVRRATQRLLSASGAGRGAAYVAPEQVKDQPISSRTDLYAVGVVAHELLVDAVPFAGEDSPLRALLRRAEEEVPDPRALLPELDPRLADWLSSLLARDPERRPAAATDAWEALEDVLVSILGPTWRRDAPLPQPEAGGATRLGPAPVLAPAGRGAETVLAGPSPPRGAETILAPGISPTPERSQETVLAGAPPREPAASETRLAPPPAVVEPAAPSETLAPEPAPVAGKRRLPLLLTIAGAALVAAAAAAIALVVLGGGDSDGAENFGPLGRPLAARERVALAVSGSDVYVTNPSGRILRLDSGSLAAKVDLTDPAAPRSVTVAGETLAVADRDAVVGLNLATLAPIGAVALDRPLVASAPDSPLVAAGPVRGGRGRVCIVSERGLDPCAEFGFAPTGLGLASAGQAFVANGLAGTVVPFTLGTNRITPGTPIQVGPGPHGSLAASNGRLFVPLASSVGIVDLSTLEREGAIDLPGRPESIWIDASAGSPLVVAVPNRDAVAIVDPPEAGSEAEFVRTNGRPAAVAGTGEVAYSANVGNGTITRLRVPSGEVLGRVRVAGLRPGRRPAPATARMIILRERPASVSATVRFTGPPLESTSVVVRDDDLSDGYALVEIWQGGIRSQAASKQLGGVGVRVAPDAARLGVTLLAAPGSFGRVRGSVGRNPRTVALEIARSATP